MLVTEKDVGSLYNDWQDRIFLYLVDSKLLSTRSKGKDTYYIPGGKREGNESDIETLIREV